MSAQPARILVVEDEGIIAMEIQHELKLAGYSVAGPAFSGRQALAIAEEARPDAVLMDIVLQGSMDGIETAERLRERIDVPIVYLTAYGDPTTVRRARTTEPYGYLVKPFRSSELLAAVEVALYKHRMERRLAASEKRFRGVVESAPSAIILIDEAGHIAFVNAAAERIFGYRREELLGRNIDVLLREPLDGGGASALPDRAAARVLNDGPRDAVGLRHDGTPFPIEMGLGTIETQEGMRVIASIVDITDVVRAREERDREHEQVRLLASRLAETQDRERRDLARILHEGLAQDLFALQLGLASLRDGSAAPQLFTELETQLARSLAELKGLSNELRPAALEHLGLLPALEGLAAQFARRSGIPVSVAGCALPLLAEPVANALYRAVQEALTNVARHATAARVVVEMVVEAGRLRLTVSDDGKGIAPQDTRKGGSLGLLGIRERLRELGGGLAIAPAPGGGTRLELDVPLTPPDASA